MVVGGPSPRRSCSPVLAGRVGQKYGAAVWSGDIPATGTPPEGPRCCALAVVHARRGHSLVDDGYRRFPRRRPYRTPPTRELVIRCGSSSGVFCPLFRLHGDREPRNPNGYAEPARWPERAVVLRERTAYETHRAGIIRPGEGCVPTSTRQMQAAVRPTGLPLLCARCSLTSPRTRRPGDRRRVQGRPADPRRPVLEAGATSRAVYLPGWPEMDRRLDGRVPRAAARSRWTLRSNASRSSREETRPCRCARKRTSTTPGQPGRGADVVRRCPAWGKSGAGARRPCGDRNSRSAISSLVRPWLARIAISRCCG